MSTVQVRQFSQTVVASATFTSDKLDMMNASLLGAQIKKTGVGSGTAKLQWSINGTNWEDIASSSKTLSTGADNEWWSIPDIGQGFVQMVIAETGGSASMTFDIYLIGKAL